MTSCTYPDHTGSRSLPDTEFDRKHSKWCRACMRLHSRRAYARNKKVQLAGNKRPEKKWECVCPRCGDTHSLKLFWTGKGKPRKFCPSCKQLSEQTDYSEYGLRA